MATVLRFTFVILFFVIQCVYSQNEDGFTSILNTHYTAIDGTVVDQNAQKVVPSYQVNSEFKLYPNPLGLSRALSISGKQLIQNIKIYSILGKELVNRNFERVKTAELNLKELTAGIYLIQINNERTSRLIVE